MPEEIIDEIKIPKKPVVFKLVDLPTRGGKEIIPNARWVPNQDRVLIKNKEYQIGFLIGKNTDGTERFGDIWFEGRHMGRLTLMPKDRLQHRNLYQYLMLCNYNESNPDRDQSVQPIFKIENSQEDARKEISKIERDNTAREAAIKLDKKQVRELSEYFGFDATQHPDVLQLKLIKQADKKPESFMEALTYVTKSGVHLESVRRGIRHDVIHLDKRGHKWRWKSTKEIFRTGNPDLDDEKNIFALAEWLRNTEDGQKVYKTLEKELEPYETEYKLD